MWSDQRDLRHTEIRSPVRRRSEASEGPPNLPSRGLLQQLGDERGPAGLVVRAQARAGIATVTRFQTEAPPTDE
jgi:hypothetical protein